MTSPPRPAADPPPGAQAERTRLAWVRTSVTMIVGAAIALRITVEQLGGGAVVLAAACAGAAAVVLVAAGRRYRRAADAMDSPADLPDGTLPAIVGGAVVALGVLVIAYTLAA